VGCLWPTGASSCASLNRHVEPIAGALASEWHSPIACAGITNIVAHNGITSIEKPICMVLLRAFVLTGI
jgi:hypothetical protein